MTVLEEDLLFVLLFELLDDWIVLPTGRALEVAIFDKGDAGLALAGNMIGG